MNTQDKYQIIEDCDESEDVKAKMRKLVVLGEECEQNALNYIQAEYGFEGNELAGIKKIGNLLQVTRPITILTESLTLEDRMTDDERAKVISAIFDYAKLIARNYHKSKTEAGL